MTAAPQRPRALWWVPAGALLIGLVLLLPPAQRLSRPLLDAQQRLMAPARAPDGVLVIDIDDASLAALRDTFGPWPYRRGIYALLIEQLRDAGARAIALDLLLADVHEGDVALARTLARPGAPVILGAAGLQHGADDDPPPAMPGDDGAGLVAESWPTLALPARSVWPAPDQPPLVGVITTPLDDDGQLRTLPLWHEARGRRWPAMPLAVWRAVDAPGRADWPLTPEGRLWLALPGPAGAPPVLPLMQVMAAAPTGGAAPALAAAVRGRVVFIGSSALLADTVMTGGGQVSGTTVLAEAYAALRDHATLRPAPAGSAALLLALGLAPALLTAWRGRAALARDGVAAGVAALGVVAAMGLALATWRMPTNGLPALATLAAGFGLAAVARQRWLVRRQQQLEYENAVTAAASQAKSEFLANVSHEIRTPMNALLGVAELLAETDLTPVQRRHVEVFRQSGQALHDLINDLLDISKIEAGHFELDHAPFALRAVLEQLMALMRPRAEQKGLQLALHCGDDLPPRVVGDRKRLEQVLLNLLGNALKFTSVGGVTLAASVERGGSGSVRFEVRDTGIGIVPSKLEAIFEPFTQADSSITRHYGGTGLGLAITRNVVTLMGGRIEVHSTPGAGSSFIVVVPLPATDAAQAPDTVPAPAAGAAAGGPRLLLAEDNEVNVYLFQAMLHDSGAQVDTAPNGPTALEMVLRRRYDLIFMDVQMPGLDGLTVTRRLRDFEAAQGRPRTPVVALTANAYASDVQASVAAGCDAHLSKPYTRQQLAALLARWATPVAGDAASAPPPADALTDTPVAPALDAAAALTRLGGDAQSYDRVRAHAAVFVAQWSQDYELARSGGHRERMRALAHDLCAVADSIAAPALREAAARLEASMPAAADTLPEGPPADVLRELGPVIVALTRGSEQALR